MLVVKLPSSDVEIRISISFDRSKCSGFIKIVADAATYLQPQIEDRPFGYYARTGIGVLHID
jgi:hypothetical protein